MIDTLQAAGWAYSSLLSSPKALRFLAAFCLSTRAQEVLG